jgi:large subunit ribosomal protein L13
MSTYFPKPGEIVRKWYVVDADGQTLGRMASQVARVLMGK